MKTASLCRIFQGQSHRCKRRGLAHGVSRAFLALIVTVAVSLLPRVTLAFTTKPHMVVVKGTVDLTTVLHNPAMGWVFYDTSDKPFPPSWWQQLKPELRLCHIWYWRDSWARLEPAPGRYAWKYNPEFKAYIRQILAHGYRLAFRVIVSSHNFSHQATPQWVRDLGVKGHIRITHGYDGKARALWTPNYDDPIFQSQFAKFVRAFGQEFDDPKKVDFIDGNGLGWWGEVHHLWLPPAELNQLYNWICSVYSGAFRHVLLVTNVFSEFSQGTGGTDMTIAHDRYGYLFRRDGLGSHWYSHDNIETYDTQMFPASPLFGELCYGNWTPVEQQEEAAKGVKSFQEDLAWATDQAIRSHANTLNFPGDWRLFPKSQVARFNRHGGYRFYPSKIAFPSVIYRGESFEVQSAWKNAGVGELPNATPQWNHKYKLCYALLRDHSRTPLIAGVVRNAHLSRWVGNATFQYSTLLKCLVPVGNYRLAVAIIDSSNHNLASIQLAVANLPHLGLWYLVGGVQVKSLPGRIVGRQVQPRGRHD